MRSDLDRYVSSAEKKMTRASRMQGTKASKLYLDAGVDYMDASTSARKNKDNDHAYTLANQALDAAVESVSKDPENKTAHKMIDKYEVRVDRLDKILSRNSNRDVESMVAPIVIGFVGAFSLVFLSNGITGNVIGIAEEPSFNMVTGVLFFLLAITIAIGIVRKNQLPHPEKVKTTKSKTKKSRKKKK